MNNKTELRATLMSCYEQAERIESLTGRVNEALMAYIHELEKQIYGKEMS